MKPSTLYTLAAGLVLVSAAVTWRSHTVREVQEANVVAGGHNAASPEAAPSEAATPIPWLTPDRRPLSSPLPPLPPHLADAMPEVRFKLTAEGELIPTPSVRTLFDFFLSGLEEEPLPTVLARIEQTLSAHLSEPALTQARALLEHYLDYRIQLDALARSAQPVMTPSGFDLAALRQREEALESLRQGNFSDAEAQAFFGLEQTQDQYMLAYLGITQNRSLSERERTRALAALDQQLPQPIRELRQRVTRHGELHQQVRQMRAAGASDAEIYQTRAQTLGDDAAARLAELDRERAQWQQRLEGFVEERERIRQSGLSAEDQGAAIDALVTRQFSGPEIARVRALSEEL